MIADESSIETRRRVAKAERDAKTAEAEVTRIIAIVVSQKQQLIAITKQNDAIANAMRDIADERDALRRQLNAEIVPTLTQRQLAIMFEINQLTAATPRAKITYRCLAEVTRIPRISVFEEIIRLVDLGCLAMTPGKLRTINITPRGTSALFRFDDGQTRKKDCRDSKPSTRR